MIKTVLGECSPTEVQNVLMHEHIACVSGEMAAVFGEDWFSEQALEAKAVKVLKELKHTLGINLFVDGSPIDLGRNTSLLQRISGQSGVHIVASAGFYYYPSMVTCKRSDKALAEWLLKDIEQNNIGILKCAVDADGVTKDIEKRIAAVSMVQAKTKLPLYVHCAHVNNSAKEVMEIFEAHHVAPKKVIFGHASRRLSVSYLEEILAQGYFICIDQSFDGEEQTVANTVYRLCEKGYEKQLLFSCDHPLHNDFEEEGQTGRLATPSHHVFRYSFLQNRLFPVCLQSGVDEMQRNAFLHENPLRVFSS